MELVSESHSYRIVFCAMPIKVLPSCLSVSFNFVIIILNFKATCLRNST
jgi:hypothetical protein